MILEIIIIVIICLILFNKFQKSKSSLKTEIIQKENVLIMACHIKPNLQLKVIQNNLNRFNDTKKFDLIIFVYSVEEGYSFNENEIQSENIVFIEDKSNIYYDFYKYKLAHSYIKKNNINYNWVFVTNDSILICEDISWIVQKIINSKKEFVGILEVNEKIFEEQPFKKHYQSWWLNFRPNVFDYWINNIIFNEKYKNVDNIINDYEINLSNNVINKFNSEAIFPLTNEFKGNVFTNNEMFYDYFYNKNFKFVKIKFFRPDVVPSKFKHLLD